MQFGKLIIFIFNFQFYLPSFLGNPFDITVFAETLQWTETWPFQDIKVFYMWNIMYLLMIFPIPFNKSMVSRTNTELPIIQYLCLNFL